jgi:hypothetical protein
MFGDPGLTPRDNPVLDLARPRKPRKGLLADVMPVDEVDPCDLHRDIDTHVARDQIQSQVQP